MKSNLKPPEHRLQAPYLLRVEVIGDPDSEGEPIALYSKGHHAPGTFLEMARRACENWLPKPIFDPAQVRSIHYRWATGMDEEENEIDILIETAQPAWGSFPATVIPVRYE